VIVVTRDNLAILRLCLESVLAGIDRPVELIVVDNGSSAGLRRCWPDHSRSEADRGNLEGTSGRSCDL
jgi:GT2 family glycosyltransferase